MLLLTDLKGRTDPHLVNIEQVELTVKEKVENNPGLGELKSSVQKTCGNKLYICFLRLSYNRTYQN